MDNTRPRDNLDAGEAGRIEVYLTPEYRRERLTKSLRRTRKRATKLLAELLKAVHEPDPDMTRMRQLADGIEFESQLARELTRDLADLGRRSDF